MPISIVAVCMKCRYLWDYALVAVFVLHNILQIKSLSVYFMRTFMTFFQTPVTVSSPSVPTNCYSLNTICSNSVRITSETHNTNRCLDINYPFKTCISFYSITVKKFSSRYHSWYPMIQHPLLPFLYTGHISVLYQSVECFWITGT